MNSDNSDADNEYIEPFLETSNTDILLKKSTEWKSNVPLSQRYVLEEDAKINIPETEQRSIAKKLAEIISQQVEYFHVPHVDAAHQKKIKSKLKLLKDANCYVESYTEPEFACKVATRKPVFKRRIIDKEDNEPSELERIQSAAITVESIMSGEEVKTWAKKPERPNKIFHYKMGNKNVANLQEPVNEFTKLRNKNQWHESKIKKKQITK